MLLEAAAHPVPSCIANVPAEPQGRDPQTVTQAGVPETAPNPSEGEPTGSRTK